MCPRVCRLDDGGVGHSICTSATDTAAQGAHKYRGTVHAHMHLSYDVPPHPLERDVDLPHYLCTGNIIGHVRFGAPDGVTAPPIYRVVGHVHFGAPDGVPYRDVDIPDYLRTNKIIGHVHFNTPDRVPAPLRSDRAASADAHDIVPRVGLAQPHHVIVGPVPLVRPVSVVLESRMAAPRAVDKECLLRLRGTARER